MFTGGLAEQAQRSVELHCINPQVLDQLMEFIYSGEIHIDQNNVQELIVAADMLELNEVVHGCTQYLKKELHPSNAIGIYRYDHHSHILLYLHCHIKPRCKYSVELITI